MTNTQDNLQKDKDTLNPKENKTGVLSLRLQSLQPSDITKDFVRKNATRKELQTTYLGTKKVRKTETFDFEEDTLEEAIERSKDLNTLLLQIQTPGSVLSFSHITGDFQEIEVVYNQEVQVEEDPEDHLQKKWKKEIQEYNKLQKDHQEYLRLKEIFG